MRNFLLISAMASCLLLAGCRHKTEAVTPSVQAPLPPEEPEQTQAEAPAPELKLPKPEPEPAPPQPTPPPEPTKHHKVKPSPATPAEPAQTAPAPAANQQTASVPSTGGASAIGQLSEGGAAASSDLRNQTVDLIASVEHRLKGISRPLTGPEQRTASQVRKFLQQASDALRNQDVDAAHTLATKANV